MLDILMERVKAIKNYRESAKKTAKELKDKGCTNKEIADAFGISEASVRYLLKE